MHWSKVYAFSADKKNLSWNGRTNLVDMREAMHFKSPARLSGQIIQNQV